MSTLMLVNPRKRRAGGRKTRTAAQKRATAKLVAMNRARRSGSRTKRRTNPITVAHAAPARRRTRRAVAAVRRHTRRRRNPIGLGNPLSMLKPALVGASGALAVNAAMNYLPVPAMLSTGRMRYVTKAALALLIGSFGGKLIGRANAMQMAEGALIVTAADALKDVLSGTGVNLGEYQGLSYYSPAQATYLNYNPAGEQNLGEYMQPREGLAF